MAICLRACQLSPFFHTREQPVAFVGHYRGYPFPKLSSKLLHGNVGVLHRIVQCGGGQKLLVGGYRGHDGHCLHRMDDVWEALPAAFCAGVGAYREGYRAVEEGSVYRCVCHCAIGS